MDSSVVLENDEDNLNNSSNSLRIDAPEFVPSSFSSPIDPNHGLKEKKVMQCSVRQLIFL